MHVGKVLLVLSSVMLCLMLFTAGPAFADNFSPVERKPTIRSEQQVANHKDINAHDYDGYLRLFVSQPVSVFANDKGEPHRHGVIGYPLNVQIHLSYPDTLRGDITYNDTGMVESNIELIGAIYELAGHTTYSAPGYPFTAHWVDAAAVATPGNPGEDRATPPYTHNVFVEYATRYS